MLAWHNPRIQAKSYGEHYFAEDELQDPSCERYKLMLEVLGDISEDIAGLFAKAWSSPTLAHCPTLSKWAHVIAAVTPSLRAETKPARGMHWRILPGVVAVCLITSFCVGLLFAISQNIQDTPTPMGLVSPVPFTEEVFSDDFSDPVSGWSTFTDDEVSKRYENGQFVIDINVENTLTWAMLEQEYEDVDFEVETVKLAGPDDSSFGLLIRYQDSDNFYYFQISSDGFYRARLLRDDKWDTLIEWTRTELIDPSERNTIAVKARGNQFTLFINGVPVDQVYDDTFSQGTIGLAASALSEPPVSIGFDNAHLRGPAAPWEVTEVPLYAQVGDSELVYSDDFSEEAGWQAHEATHSRSFYDHGEYHIEVLESDIIMHFPSSDSWPDVIIDVDARQVSGSGYGSYGLDCRYQDQDNFYELAIRTDGYYRILMRQGGEYRILKEWTATNAIYQGQASNHLTAICEGDRLALWVNGEFVTEVFDDSLSEGSIALVASPFEKPNVLVAFDNLRVSVPVTAQATAAATKASTPVTTVEDEWSVVTIKKGDPIKLGFAAGLSGAGIDVLGLDEQRGAELAVKDRPEVLGFTVELRVEDSQCNAEGGRTAANEFVADPQIVGVVGHMCSSSCSPAAIIYERNGYTMVSPSCTTPSLTAPDTGTAAFNRVGWNDKIQGPAAAKFVYETLGGRKVATIHDGSPYAELLGQEFTEAFEALGGRIVTAETVDVGDTDMRPVLTRIKVAEPELIYWSGCDVEGGYLVNQMADVGMEDVLFMGGDGIKWGGFIRAAGDAAKGVYASAVDFAEADPDLPEFLKAYEAEYGEEPIARFHAHAYDATMVILNAIEKVGQVDGDGNLLIGRKALNEAIRRTKGYKGLTGTITCDEYGDCGAGSVDIFVVKDGEWVLVE
jgi:branched-chain amino acid transport system substrate-binding protein